MLKEKILHIRWELNRRREEKEKEYQKQKQILDNKYQSLFQGVTFNSLEYHSLKKQQEEELTNMEKQINDFDSERGAVLLAELHKLEQELYGI